MVLTVFTAIAVILISVFIWRLRNYPPLFLIALGGILGGAMGNLLDRFIYGKVVDFIDLRLFSIFVLNKTYGIYIFNFADIAISAGVICLILFLNKQTKESNDC